MPFTKLGLSKQIQTAIKEKGYKEPTPIQEKVIPLFLQGHDIMAMAQTGSGKSASFVLPILELLSKNKTHTKSRIKVLVLTPTRELTLQVAETFDIFSTAFFEKPKVVALIGGESIGNQLYDIQQGCDILVATSGRFLDVLSKKQMNLSHLEYFILDEAEQDAIDGAKETIQKYKPILAVCIYHRAEDWYKIPQKVLALESGYKLYLRHYMEGIFESVMYFIPEK